jgi:hypothetical protein
MYDSKLTPWKSTEMGPEDDMTYPSNKSINFSRICDIMILRFAKPEFKEKIRALAAYYYNK